MNDLTLRRDYAADVRAFEKKDRINPSAPGGIVIYGSTPVALWETLCEDLAPFQVIGRGLVGARYSDLQRYVDRLVLMHAPRQVVIYAGEEDLVAGLALGETNAEYHRFVDTVQAALPHCLVSVISIKASPERWTLVNKIDTTNHLVHAYTADRTNLDYIDLFEATIGHNGLPRPDLYSDGLNLTREGYAIWAKEIAENLLP
jgi:lysophospholipase L1-like esterase